MPLENGHPDSAGMPLRVVIVGCGMVAGGYDESVAARHPLSHAGAYRIDRRFSIIACVEPDDRRREAFKERWNIPQGFADLDDMIGSGIAFDVASICAPDPAHAELLETLLETPVKGVLCEKPITTSAEQSRRMAAAYEAAGKVLVVNYLRRFDPAMTALAGEIRNGSWGAIQSVTAHYTKGIRHNGCHMIDLLLRLLGPLSFRSVIDRRRDVGPGDATVTACLTTERDAPVILVGGDHTRFTLFEATIIAEKGRVDILDSGFSVRRRRIVTGTMFPSHRYLDDATAEPTELDRAMSRSVGNLHDAVRYGVAPLSSGPTALPAEILCESILDAADVGEPP